MNQCKKKDEKIYSTKMLQNCTFVKTILMAIVILGHSIAFWSGHWFTENPIIESDTLNYIYVWLNSFHIYSFVLVSGYIFAFKMNGGGYSSYLPFLKNKAKRLVIPYIFVALIWVVPISEYFFHWDGTYLFNKYILCINPSQLWFQWMLLGVFVIVWPLYKVFSRNLKAGAILVVLIYGVGLVGNKLLPNVFCIWSACLYIPFFYVGILIRQRQEKGCDLIINKVPWWAWLIADGILYIIYIFLEKKGSVLNVGIIFMLHMVGAIGAFVILQKVAGVVKWKDNKAFRVLSSYSMPMYLFHQQIIYFTIYWLNGRVNPYINAGVNFLAAVVGSMIISAILMRFKVTRYLIGEKPLK